MDGATPKIDLRGQGATANDNTVILLDGIPFNGLVKEKYQHLFL